MRVFSVLAVLVVLVFCGAGLVQASENIEQLRAKAEQGDAQAQYNLGVIYAKGQGVPQDYTQAYMWLNLAAAQGDTDAIKWRDLFVKDFTPSQIEEGQRLAREWMAARPGRQ